MTDLQLLELIEKNKRLIELIELLRRPTYVWSMNRHNKRLGSVKAAENALGEIELLIYAYAKKRIPEIDEALRAVNDGSTEPSA